MRLNKKAGFPIQDTGFAFNQIPDSGPGPVLYSGPVLSLGPGAGPSWCEEGGAKYLKSAKRSTSSHKMGQKLGFSRRDRGMSSDEVHFEKNF